MLHSTLENVDIDDVTSSSGASSHLSLWLVRGGHAWNRHTHSVVISPIRYFSTSPPGAESVSAGTFSEDWRRELMIDPKHSSASVCR
jgi:hypothetical protein